MVEPAPAPPADGSDRGRIADIWLGLQVRALRKAKRLSLKQLAERAGLSIGMISQIERGISSPSIRSLRQLSDALDVPPARFFHEGAVPPLAEIGKIVRSQGRRMLMLPSNGVSKQLLTPDTAGVLEMLLVVIEPGGSSGPEHYTHKGEEAGYVLSGAIELWIADACHRLEAGDSFRFKSTTPHRFASAAPVRSEVLWVITPPLY